MKSSIYSYLTHIFEIKGAAFLALIDPDASDNIEHRIHSICANGADAILVGGSIVGNANFDAFVNRIKSVVQASHQNLPVIIFPGNSMQLSKHADAILFLSLLSGRNPEYLIGEQVKASPIIKEMGLEVIPTGYLLIESGNLTSVLFMSHTLPIPRNKIDIAKYHALTAEYLGMKFVYFDAGSGAQQSMPNEMITAVKNYISIPIIVGGGIHTPDEAKAKVSAGANAIVIGDALQDNPDLAKDFASAIHKK